ncbi:MAG: glycosyltransferase [Desulfobacteraceae bacterium]|nr:glycosyltransferase [Desulfobacteraceae bacterium]
MEKKIKIGVLGCSSIAERSILPALVDSEYFELISVAAQDSAKGEMFAKKFNCNSCSYEELISNDQLEAVYVSLPVSLHYEWGKKSIDAGKHLLLEKTFTMDYTQAQDIITSAISRDLVSMEALMYVYHPLFSKVHDLVDSGSIGNIRHIDASFGLPDLPENNIRNYRDLGGGAILDALVYPLSLCLSMNKNKPKSISWNIISHEKHDVDARGSVKLDWDNFSASINFGFGFMYRNTYSIWGDQGYLNAERVFSRTKDYCGPILLSKQGGTETIDVTAANHFDLMLTAFYKKIKKQDLTAINEKGDILRRMEIISDIYKDTYGFDGNRANSVDVSVVIPVYFSEKNIQTTVTEIETVLKSFYNYEIILVNDGSTDNSFGVIKNMAKNSQNIIALNLMRNFGQHNAVMAGLREASGRYVVCMDDDGQHDPAYIPLMIEKIKEGYDVVYTKYEHNVYSASKKLGSSFNNFISSWLLDKPSDLYLSSFKAMKKEVKDQINQYSGPYPYLDGIILSATQSFASIPARHRGTAKPETTYSFTKLVRLWLNMFTNFSVKPLRLISMIGSVTFIISIILMIGLSLLKILNSDLVPPGWTMLAVLILFFGAIQLICIGMVGEYVGRILILNNKRPQFIVKERVKSNG